MGAQNAPDCDTSMLIREPDPKTRTVHDFEFSFVNDYLVNFTYDPESGDTWDNNGPLGTMIINLSAKPSPDGSFLYPAETFTLTRDHVVSIKRSERVVTDLTQAQKELWKLTIQEMGKTIQ